MRFVSSQTRSMKQRKTEVRNRERRQKEPAEQYVSKRQIGSNYEQASGYYLEQQGYKILEYNYRCRMGEIDLIAQDGEYLVFCEVKYRKTYGSGSPLEAVDVRKQRVIRKVAEHYLMMHRINEIPCRFDVIGIEGSRISLIKNAF